MTLRFSSRTSWELGESDFAAAIRARRGSPGLIDLTVSNPTQCGFTYDAAAILGPLADPGALIYDPDPLGSRPARDAVAAYYADHHAAVDPDQILLTTSTSEAYSHLFRLLCNAGDEVLVAAPSYPLFDFLADLSDVRLRPYPLFYDFGWWIDFAELERRISDRTRAILVVHPNNPTGHWTHAAERQRLRQVCARHHLALIVDEVFLDYSLLDGQGGRSFAAEDCGGVLTLILSGISKVAALPQMKVAWMLVHGRSEEAREAVARLEVIADTFLSVNAPMQHALPRWLADRGPLQQQVIERIKANWKMAALLGVPLLHVEAGWSLVLQTSISAEALLREYDVITHPGGFYAMAERHRLVVSLLTPEAVFCNGLERTLAAAMRV